MSAGRGTGCAASLATSSGPMGSGSGPGAAVKDHATRPTHSAPAPAFARLSAVALAPGGARGGKTVVAGVKHDGARRGGERVAGVKHDTVDESRHNMLCTACARGIGTMWTPKVMATAPRAL
eukprot:scaffold100422_cov54-Phaeocystis_antarctica.AAC.1